MLQSNKRFVILDRDGTINEDFQYISDPQEVKLLPGAVQGLKQLQKMGLGLVVITNQSGIGRNFFPEAKVLQVNQRLCRLLEKEGVLLDGIYLCPHCAEDRCHCRKPETGLVERAAQELHFLPRECFVIGDKESDIEVGFRMGATSFLISPQASEEVPLLNRGNFFYYLVKDLSAAAKVIRNLLLDEAKT
jgi:D-glycero-D-manno-heptose 1,7-bisphosphate phosphatase